MKISIQRNKRIHGEFREIPIQGNKQIQGDSDTEKYTDTGRIQCKEILKQGDCDTWEIRIQGSSNRGAKQRDFDTMRF